MYVATMKFKLCQYFLHCLSDLSTVSQRSYDLMKTGEGKAIIFMRMMKLYLREYRGKVCMLGSRVYHVQAVYCQHYQHTACGAYRML